MIDSCKLLRCIEKSYILYICELPNTSNNLIGKYMVKLNSKGNVTKVEQKESYQTDNKTTTEVKPATVESNSMFEKTQVQTRNEKDDKFVVLKVIGLAIIIFGLLALLILGIIAIVTRISPRVDKSMERPVLVRLPEYTNQEVIKVEGSVNGVSEVIVYADNKVDSVIKVQDGKFAKEIKLTAERKYTFEAAGVKGLILRSRSEKSDAVSTTFDKTAPSSKIELIDLPKEVSTSKLDIKGKAEPNSIVVFNNGEKDFSAKANAEGEFTMLGIELKPGNNEFSIEIKDMAGNSTKVKETFSINYNASANINGSGASTSNNSGTTNANALPNSAGPLDEAMAAIMQNKLMFGFGVFALVLFLLNSAIVGSKLYFENKR